MAPSTYVHNPISKWIEENKKFFLPPVCNKMMHGDGQLKVFYVGGPNQRKDFHLEEGEEFFYMVKGDMNLITLANGSFRDVIIKEGEVFLLPGKIPHSPQRFENTVGLVIERERMMSEKDCLRYFVEGTTNSLFEKWFYCEDLGTQLGPVIKEYFASEQHKTGKPLPGTIPEIPPWTPDAERLLAKPFPLDKWISKHKAEIHQEGSKRLFDLSYQSDVIAYGGGKSEMKLARAETWLWQLEGETTVTMGEQTLKMVSQDSLLIRKGISYALNVKDDSVLLSVVMDPGLKHRGFGHLEKKKKKKEEEEGTKKTE